MAGGVIYDVSGRLANNVVVRGRRGLSGVERACSLGDINHGVTIGSQAERRPGGGGGVMIILGRVLTLKVYH